nr:MAG TPA: hypothetical protein [Bacteriophage sp.]
MYRSRIEKTALDARVDDKSDRWKTTAGYAILTVSGGWK